MKKHLLFLATGLILSAASFGQYCTSGLYGSACSFGDNLNNFSFSTISNLNSGCGGVGGYNNFTAQSTTLVPGVVYNWSASTSYPCCEHFALWIDFNNDQDFNDAGEQIYTSGATGTSWSGTFACPPTPGTFRMRARVKYAGSSMSSTQACSYFSYGEVEDYTVTILPPALTAVVSSPIDLTCYGDTTATLSANIFGGTLPYTYAWSNGSVDSAQFNMGGGTYTLTVTDGVGDTNSASIVVFEPDSIGLSTSVITNLICDYDVSQGFANGSGGTEISEAYTMDTASANYNWDSSGTCTVVPLPGSSVVSGVLGIGFDFVFYGDTFDEFQIARNGYIGFGGNLDNGCCSGEPVPHNSIYEPNNAIFAAWFDVDADQGISYCLSGDAPFRKLIVNFVALGDQGVDDNYTGQIILHETSNCIEIQTDYMQYQGSYNQYDDCTQGITNMGSTLGQAYPGRNADEGGASGGWEADDSYVQFCPVDTTGLAYTWSTGDVGATVYGLPAGTYTVTATDGNGCMNTSDLTIDPAISNLVSALDAIDVSCFGFDDATINPAITGGVSPVNYTWSNGASSATLASLQPGTYSVSAEDAVGCTIEVNNITIMEPAILVGSVYDLQNVICSNDENGSASIVVSGGVPPYSPVWSNGEIAYTATSLSAGANYVVVTDANGCEAFLSVNVLSDFDSPTPNIGNSLISANGAGVTLSTQPNTYSSYLWNTGATSATLLAANTGFYWVEVTNSAGCIGSDTAFVEVWPTGVAELKELAGVTMYPNPARDMINFNISSEINSLNVSIVDSKGSIVATRIFNNSGIQNISLENIAAGIYSVQFSDENGQMSTKRLVVSK